MLTNADVLKKSLLNVETIVTFQLNLGNSLAAAIDITDKIINVGDLSEKLSKSATDTGGVLLPNLKIKLDNSKGLWNKLGTYFKNGFVNNSLINIETYYKPWTEKGAFSNAFNFLQFDVGGNYRKIKPSFKYSGLIKYSSCDWDRDKFIFQATLIPASNLLSTEKIEPGILSHTTFKNICYKILNRQPFIKYMTIDLENFSLGWDVTTIDSYEDMTNKKVKDVLDKIMQLTGSIYYVDYDNNFIIEPIIPTSPNTICTLRGDDIFSVNSEDFNWAGQFTAITWDDTTNPVQKVEMNYPARALYQYDFVELTLAEKYVTDITNRTTILNNLLELYKWLKRQVKITCKWNPEIIVNKYISLDIPEEVVIGTDYLIWNKNNWNEGKFWGIGSPGISFLSTELWRVTDIKRDTTGEKMQLTLVQLYSDDNR
jgi:hypothetical protein